MRLCSRKRAKEYDLTTADDEREAEQVDVRKVGEVHAVNGVTSQ